MRHRLTRTVIATAAILLLTISMASSYSTIRAAPPDNPDYSVDGCTITITFTTISSESDYTFEVYSGRVLLYSETQFVGSSGETVTFTYTIPADSDPPVIGLVIELLQDGEPLATINDPDFDSSKCAGGTSDCSIDEGAYQGRLLATKQLFWAANEDSPVTPYTAIPVGKAVNILSEKEGWYKIQWACGYYYITTTDVSVNYDPIAKPYLAASGGN
jgi:hypothetical protein